MLDVTNDVHIYSTMFYMCVDPVHPSAWCGAAGL